MQIYLHTSFRNLSSFMLNDLHILTSMHWNSSDSDLILYFITGFLNHSTSFNPLIVFNAYHPPPCLRSNKPFVQKPAQASYKTCATLFYIGIYAWNYLLSTDLGHSYHLSNVE